MMTTNLADDDWPAGFADGEGSFCLCGTQRGLIPNFTINLTDTDAPIVRELQRTFGGSVNMKPKRLNTGFMSRPTVIWQVRDKAGLHRLIDYFDARPLRTKKAVDYGIWRRAVVAYVEGSYLSPELLACRHELDAIRPGCGRRAARFTAAIAAGGRAGQGRRLAGHEGFRNGRLAAGTGRGTDIGIFRKEEAMSRQFANDDWLTGFADGEGSFSIVAASSSTQNLRPEFTINQNSEDAPILRQLMDSFGGRVNIVRHKVTHGYLTRPTAIWQVRAKAGLRRLFDYFDAHPPRSKKAIDYAIWRRAVVAYIAEGSSSAEVRRCRQELDDVRPGAGRRATRFTAAIAKAEEETR